jgi:hypothetical protein
MLITLAIIKAVGIVLAGGFSILGLLTEFKDKRTHRVTRWGRIALYGIVSSTLVSLLSQTLESWKANADNLSATLATQNQLSALNRVLTQIADIHIHYRFALPLNDTSLEDYHKRLMEAAKDSPVIGFGPGVFNLTPTPKSDGGIAYSLIMCPNFGLNFYERQSKNGKSSLVLTLEALAVPDSAKYTGPPKHQPTEFYEFVTSSKRIHVTGDMFIEPDQWHLIGNSFALSDFPNGRIEFIPYAELAPCVQLPTAPDLQHYLELRNTIEIEGVTITLAGRAFEAFSKDFTPTSPYMPGTKEDPIPPLKQILERYVDRDGHLAYELDVPPDLKQLEVNPFEHHGPVIVGAGKGAVQVQ